MVAFYMRFSHKISLALNFGDVGLCVFTVYCYDPLVWYEPTCVDKAIKPITAGVHSKLSYTSPNLSELRAMFKAITGEEAVNTQHTNGTKVPLKL